MNKIQPCYSCFIRYINYGRFIVGSGEIDTYRDVGNMASVPRVERKVRYYKSKLHYTWAVTLSIAFANNTDEINGHLGALSRIVENAKTIIAKYKRRGYINIKQ